MNIHRYPKSNELEVVPQSSERKKMKILRNTMAIMIQFDLQLIVVANNFCEGWSIKCYMKFRHKASCKILLICLDCKIKRDTKKDMS